MDEKNFENIDDAWIPIFLTLLAFPKPSYTEIQLAELKGRLDTIEKIVLKGDK